jgi:hypothetical protein
MLSIHNFRVKHYKIEVVSNKIYFAPSSLSIIWPALIQNHFVFLPFK